jgi:hypothetical protein
MSKDAFIELKTTENQTLFVRKESVGAFEVAASTAHVEGHIKVYVAGFKFLVQAEKDVLLQQLSEDTNG